MVSFENPLLLLLSLRSHGCHSLRSSYRSPIDSRLILVDLRPILLELLYAFLKDLEHIILLINLIALGLQLLTIAKNKVTREVIIFFLPIGRRTIPMRHIVVDISVMVIDLHRWLPFVQPLSVSFDNFIIPVNLHLLELLYHRNHLFLRKFVGVFK